MGAELSDEQILDHYATTISTSQGAYLIAVARKIIGADRALRPSGGQLQAKIDALMLEYCPDEMTEEQKANWAGHQVSAPVEISSWATCGHPVESGGERPAELSTDECICRGNWRAIVKETEHLIDRKFLDRKHDVWQFFGIVHGADDYYYGMNRKGQLSLLSCVGSIEGHGYQEFVQFTADPPIVYEPPAPLEWDEPTVDSASGSQESGSTECKESSPLSPNESRALCSGTQAGTGEQGSDTESLEPHYKSMFEAAVSALAEIDQLLEIEADGCNSPAGTVAAVRTLKRQAEQAQALARPPLSPASKGIHMNEVTPIQPPGAATACEYSGGTCLRRGCRGGCQAVALANKIQVAALRYQWLREAAYIEAGPWCVNWADDPNDPSTFPIGREDLDAAIDLAMAESDSLIEGESQMNPNTAPPSALLGEIE